MERQKNFKDCTMIDSGNGLHIIFIGEMIPINKEDYGHLIEHIFSEFSKCTGDDLSYITLDTSSKNISQLFRLPGVVNYNRKTKRGLSPAHSRIIKTSDRQSYYMSNLEEIVSLKKNTTNEESTVEDAIATQKSFYRKHEEHEILIKEICKLPNFIDDICKEQGWKIDNTYGNKGKINFRGGLNSNFKGCFFSKSNNLLILTGTPHFSYIPSSWKGCNYFQYISKKEKKNYQETIAYFLEKFPGLKNKEKQTKKEGEYFIGMEQLINEAVSNRRMITNKNICSLGLEALNKYYGGILPKELVVIAAPTGCGKSDLCYTIAMENAKAGKKVALFNLEGDIQEPAYRKLIQAINTIQIEKGERTFTPLEYRFNLNNKIHNIECQAKDILQKDFGKNLKIFDKKQLLNVDKLEEILVQVQHNVDLIIIDHLHYLDYKPENENAEISKIMRRIKMITDTIGIPIVLACHIRKKHKVLLLNTLLLR